MFYYIYRSSRDSKYHLRCEPLDPYLMCGDYLLFDSAEACLDYYQREGVEVIA